MRIQQNGIRCLAVLLCLLLLSFCSITVSASDIKVYDTEFDTEMGKMTIHIHNGYSVENTVNLLAPIREAAALNAAVQINAGNIRFYLNADAVQKYAATGAPIYVLAKMIDPTEETTAEAGTDEPIETAEPVVEKRYLIRLGNVDFEYGSVRIRIRYVPQNAEILTVLSRDAEGRERELTFGYAEKYVSFYPEAMGEELEFVIAERTAPIGTPKLPFLLGGVLAVLLIASAVGAVLLMTGARKRLPHGSNPDSP